MKLALTSPANERQLRRERLKRNRAMAPALRQVFPKVQQLRFDLVFEARGPTSPAMQSHTLHEAARAFFEFPCPYADCDGQYDLSAAVKTALAAKTHKAKGALQCAGKHGARVAADACCGLQLEFTVTAALYPES
jgi:hypothetical protein